MTKFDHLLNARGGEQVQLSALGVRFLIGSHLTGSRFSLVEHPLPPKSLGAPLHTHAHEDEYSYVLEGRLGVQIGDDVIEAQAGDLIFKPRGVPHAFWNQADEPARMLELISPGGFETYFREMAVALEPGNMDFGKAAEICGRYGIDMRYETIPKLMNRYGLQR